MLTSENAENANFALTEFSEVRTQFCSVGRIRWFADAQVAALRSHGGRSTLQNILPC
jgi:hypothetical protein